jgi:putative ABC transport system ATP-binding protein
MRATVEVRDVTKDYKMGQQWVHALRGVSLTIHEGELTVIAGPSGSGKTTLLNIIGCMDVPTRGDVVVDGESVASLNEARLTRFRLRHLGYVFQSFNLIPVLTVYQNVELPLLLQGGMSGSERERRVRGLLGRVGIESYMKHRPLELSGGQQQRVAVARALVAQPKLVLADEPTANLDGVTGAQIVDLIREMARTEKTTVVFSTHDPRVLAKADRVIDIADGLLAGDRRASPAEPAASAGSDANR